MADTTSTTTATVAVLNTRDGRRMVLALSDAGDVVLEMDGKPPRVLTRSERAILRVALGEELERRA